MNLRKTSVIYLILVLFSQVTFAQLELQTDYIKNLPAFTMFGDNYFVTGTSLDEGGFTSETSDAKFEIGFKERLINVSLPLGLFPFISYRQKSFWDIYKESYPFRETNYNPAIGLVKLLVDENGISHGFWLALEHESNGRDGENSRTWNLISLSYFKPFGRKWQFRSKIWLPIGKMSGNEDIISYRGYFSLGISYNPLKNTFVDLDVQPAFKDKLTGFVKLAVSFRISKERNQFLYLQYFRGYSEDLINYDKYSNNLRIGIVFKDLFANFEQ